jgi:hypothetical protein
MPGSLDLGFDQASAWVVDQLGACFVLATSWLEDFEAGEQRYRSLAARAGAEEPVVSDTALACGRHVPVRTLDTSHSSFLSESAQLADYVIELAWGTGPQ